MLNEEEKQTLEKVIAENTEKNKLQQELQKLVDKVLDNIIEKESKE